MAKSKRAHVPAKEKIATEYPFAQRDVTYIQGEPPPDNLADMALAYTSHVWAYAGIWQIATNLANLPILPYRKAKDGKWQLYEKHPFYAVLQKPNSWMSQAMLKEITFINGEIGGNAYWLLLKTLGEKRGVTEIWPLKSSQIKVYPGRSTPVDHYGYTVNSKEKSYAPEDIIHFRYMNPANDSWGIGSIGPAKEAIAADMYATQWNKFFFANMGRPDGVLETDKMLTDVNRRRMVEMWKQKFQGVRNRGAIAILEEGLKYNETNRTPVDMDFVNQKKMSREEVLAALGVPPAVVGLFEYANYANSREQRRLFWENTLMPKARAFADILTLRASQITGDTETVFQPDTTGIEAMRQDQFALARTAALYVNMGFPPNEVVTALDLPVSAFKGGDVSRPPSSSGGFGSSSSSTNEPPPPGGKAALGLIVKMSRDSMWREFEALHAKHEAAMGAAVRGYFKGQKRRVLEALNKHGASLFKDIVAAKKKPAEYDTKMQPAIIVQMIFDGKKETRLLKDASTKYVSGPYGDFAMRTAKMADPQFKFDLANPRAQAFIEHKTAKLAMEVNAYTKEQLTDSVVDAVAAATSEGFNAGESIQQIADRIDEIYNFAQTGRSERIARTETIGASNAGAEEAMTQTGVEKKEWLTARDENVRETHQEMDGQTQDVGDPFVTPDGATLDFPGDPNGPLGEIINCRCTVLPVISSND